MICSLLGRSPESRIYKARKVNIYNHSGQQRAVESIKKRGEICKNAENCSNEFAVICRDNIKKKIN